MRTVPLKRVRLSDRDAASIPGINKQSVSSEDFELLLLVDSGLVRIKSRTGKCETQLVHASRFEYLTPASAMPDEQQASAAAPPVQQKR